MPALAHPSNWATSLGPEVDDREACDACEGDRLRLLQVENAANRPALRVLCHLLPKQLWVV